MEEPTSDRRRLASWLDRLQQESWQLELLISGFVIFLLIGGLDRVMLLPQTLFTLTDQSTVYLSVSVIGGLLSVAYIALLVALIFHVVMRGLWIAAIGLRYISGDIDYDALGYQARYRRWLRRSMGSFDEYIERLERYCSVIFSVAFLIIFCFLSLAGYCLFIFTVQVVFTWFSGGVYNEQLRGIFGGNGMINLLCIIPGVIYLIDFFTLGFFKRNRHTARAYYPVYRFMGWVTFAALYRPLYHNLVDDRFGRRLARLLPVFVFGTMLLLSVNVITHAYFPYALRDGRVWIDHRNYDDEEANIRGQRWRVSLGSRYVKNDYVEAFVAYRPRFQDPVIRQKFPDLEVARYTGIRFGEPLQFSQMYNTSSDYSYDSLLTAVSSLYRLYVDDSLRTDIQPRFHYHTQREQEGLLYMVPAHGMEKGEHNLQIAIQYRSADSLRWVRGAHIYFYR
jgi:hypothetical protein